MCQLLRRCVREGVYAGSGPASGQTTEQDGGAERQSTLRRTIRVQSLVAHQPDVDKRR